MKISLAERIAICRRRLAEAKPRSYIKIRLELELRAMVLQQLKREIRRDANSDVR